MTVFWGQATDNNAGQPFRNQATSSWPRSQGAPRAIAYCQYPRLRPCATWDLRSLRQPLPDQHRTWYKKRGQVTFPANLDRSLEGCTVSVGWSSPDRSPGCTCPLHGTAVVGIRDRSCGNSFPPPGEPRVSPGLSVDCCGTQAIPRLSWYRPFHK